MIRELTVQDLPSYAELGPLFFKEGGLPGEFKADVFVRKWTQLLESNSGFMLGLEEDGEIHGALGAIVFPDINDDEVTASEAFWFVRPEKRGGGMRLLAAFERKAEDLGARRIIMAHLHNLHPKELQSLYERRGYHAIETNYLKVVAP